ncbi:MAG: helix-turn-helix transcriptional regulator [Lachnospiraceae bacterium]|nr:helix-turn-helix transcriptional regulator [Lachnospiraceae bacterium]
MAERKNYDQRLVDIGILLSNKRKALGPLYGNREKFIELRKEELFNSEDWISNRHLTNIELGKNMISIEKMILLAAALETDPVELFKEIYEVYINKN